MRVKRMKNGIDGSKQYKLEISKGCYVEACIDKGILICHSWFCEGKGRLALQEIEAYAKKHNLRVQVPTVLSPALAKILKDNGYVSHEETFEDPFGGKDTTDVWEKRGKYIHCLFCGKSSGRVFDCNKMGRKGYGIYVCPECRPKKKEAKRA